jgi:hypothetical protein
MKINTLITRKQLESLPKADLAAVIREMEAYLVNIVNTNDEMYWRGSGPPEHKQACVTREIAMKDATVRLRDLVNLKDTNDKH